MNNGENDTKLGVGMTNISVEFGGNDRIDGAVSVDSLFVLALREGQGIPQKIETDDPLLTGAFASEQTRVAVKFDDREAARVHYAVRRNWIRRQRELAEVNPLGPVPSGPSDAISQPLDEVHTDLALGRADAPDPAPGRQNSSPDPECGGEKE